MESSNELRLLLLQDQHDPVLWYRLGIALHCEGRRPESIAALRNALACTPDDAELCVAIGCSLLAFEETDLAQSALLRACMLDPESLEAHTWLGELFLRAGAFRAAIDEFLHAARLDGRKQQVRAKLVDAYHMIGELESAAHHLETLASAHPDPERYRRLAAFYIELGRPDDTVRALRALVAMLPSDVAASSSLGIALSTAGLHTEAVRVLAGVVERMPGSSRVLADLGLAMSRAGMHDSALRQLEAAVALDPKCREALCNLGIARKAAGALEDAIGAFRAAIEVSLDWTTARYNLAVVLTQLGKLEPARAELASAAAIDPRDSEIGRALRELTSQLSQNP